MSENITNIEDRVKPVKVQDHVSSNTYELDFSRESVKFAESRGFKLDEVTDFPATKIPELFWYAFRKNHKNMALNQTSEILERMGGVTPALLGRLSQLYNQAALTHLIISDEDAAKNEEVTVEL